MSWRLKQKNKYKEYIPIEKYNESGIYCIKANEEIIYIGKSKNMRERIAEHIYEINWGGEKKYRILREMRLAGVRIGFDVLEYTEDLKEAEGRLIRKYLPILNTQIPKEEGGWLVHDISYLLDGEWEKYLNQDKMYGLYFN